MQHATDRPVDPAAPRAEPKDLRGAASVDLAVAGMGCPSCANRIRNALRAHPGVVEVEVDVPALLAHVWYVPAQVNVREMLAVVSVVGQATHHQYVAVPIASAPRPVPSSGRAP